MVVVGLLVEGDQDVELVAGAENSRRGDPRLGPGGPAEDLGRECRKGLNVVSGLGGGLSQGFGGSYDALPSFTGESDYKIFPNQDYLQLCEDCGVAQKPPVQRTSRCVACVNAWAFCVVFFLTPTLDGACSLGAIGEIRRGAQHPRAIIEYIKGSIGCQTHEASN